MKLVGWTHHLLQTIRDKQNKNIQLPSKLKLANMN